MSDYKPIDFNHKGRSILNKNYCYAPCLWCGFDMMQAADMYDDGKREHDNPFLLQVIEDIDERGDSWLSLQWECLGCHKNGMFQNKGPRTDDDMFRKQRDAMQRQYQLEGGE